jgi:hypothetical protein
MQRKSCSLHNVYCGPGHIQCKYSSAYSGFNIQMNVSALQLEIWRQFNRRYTANTEHNTAHTLQLWLCEQWPRTYSKYLQLRICRLQYSTERISAAIGDITTIQCALCCIHVAKHSAHPPVYAIWTVVPDIYNVYTVPHILASIFKWTYLRCYWRYVDNSMCVILQTWCQYSAQTPVYAM